MDEVALKDIAEKLVTPTKGILAADESAGTIEKRFESIGLESTEENRRNYREMLLTTDGIEEFLSGVILFDETIRQSAGDGRPFAQLLNEKGMIPGIKVDKGTVELTNFPEEKITEGLDELRERLIEYHGLGARFTKWRAVIKIADNIPTKTCLEANAEVMARYAALVQSEDMVPIIEPEVLMEGGHELARTKEVTEAVLKLLFTELEEHRVFLEGILIKTNMAVPGKDNPKKAEPIEVAAATTNMLKEVIPSEVPGVVFLSGGQTPAEATANLNEINKLGRDQWELSFSFARALQEEALKTWRGDPGNVKNAQEAFYHRASLVSLARQGKYESNMEK